MEITIILVGLGIVLGLINIGGAIREQTQYMKDEDRRYEEGDDNDGIEQNN